MLGFDSVADEYVFHQKASWAILYLAPLVVFILMGFRPPTYGKHVTAGKTKGSKETIQTQSDDNASDIASTSESSNASTSLLRKRRCSGNSETTPKNTICGTSPASDDNKQKTKEKMHWLGPKFPAKWSWVFFESPCWIWVFVCLWDFYHYKEDDEERLALPIRNKMLLGWFTFHYLYRSLWYPLVMMKTTSAKIPLGIIVMACAYCCVNGYLQARDLTKFSLLASGDSPLSSESAYQFWFGISVMLCGWYINFTSDRILQRIKQEKQQKLELRQSRKDKQSKSGGVGKAASRYAVPYGGFFEYVSSPHYFGEFMEWTGFCIANDFSLASVSFVVWTGANLIPRAIHTHKWYNDTFVGCNGEESDDDDCDNSTDYSKLDRKAIIPFIL